VSFRVRVDQHGNVDRNDIQRQVANKISGWIWGLILGAFIFVVVIGGIAGIFIWGFYQAKQAQDEMKTGATSSGPSMTAWNDKSTFDCTSNMHAALSGMTINIANGPTIKAGGNCELSLTNMKITSPTVIEAAAGSKVTVTGGEINGNIKASAAAKVTVVGAKFTGKVDKSGAATVDGVK
jgi:hypothetical protein